MSTSKVRKRMPESPNQAIWEVARAFHWAARRLGQAVGEDRDAHPIPVLVNQLFSLELYLKCFNAERVSISSDERGSVELLFSEGERGHDLGELYAGIAEALREGLESDYAILPPGMQLIDKLASLSIDQPARHSDLRSALKHLGDAFEYVRYPFEPPAEPKPSSKKKSGHKRSEELKPKPQNESIDPSPEKRRLRVDEFDRNGIFAILDLFDKHIQNNYAKPKPRGKQKAPADGRGRPSAGAAPLRHE